MAKIIVGISDLRISGNVEDTLITYALGSCIAIAVYDPRVKVGGLLHFMLPDSKIESNKAKATPGMFADTGIPLLFKSCYRLGAQKKYMIIKIAGGADILDSANYFRIGQRNIITLKKIFWKNNVLINGEDTGGKINRTVSLDISTGKVIVKKPSRVLLEL
ncbi:MAG: chemotaxis protein CheD [Desulfobacterales bacterium]|nr:chemotaxis protein CheD [Desulfobacterales bacterium]MBU8909909.1 chemotaxis protein CheD [Desulfobacterales bacterium]